MNPSVADVADEDVVTRVLAALDRAFRRRRFDGDAVLRGDGICDRCDCGEVSG